MEKISTKQRIIEEALSLFSQYGYNGTSVKKIAEAVGIKDSSIYKHFNSKQEIFNQIVATISQRIEKKSLEVGLPNVENLEDLTNYYVTFTKDKLVEYTRKMVLFYLTDSYVVQFRKLAIREQYSNEVIYEVYRKYYMESSIEFLTVIFKGMIKLGGLKNGSPEIMAYFFYSPIFFLLNKYDDKENEVEEALKLLDQMVEEFYKIYFLCA
ncbi:MAG: TetR/AcrR family transcriptional regulator [Lachnotalea sp.]